MDQMTDEVSHQSVIAEFMLHVSLHKIIREHVYMILHLASTVLSQGHKSRWFLIIGIGFLIIGVGFLSCIVVQYVFMSLHEALSKKQLLPLIFFQSSFEPLRLEKASTFQTIMRINVTAYSGNSTKYTGCISYMICNSC